MLYDTKWDKEVKVVDEVGQILLKMADYIEKHGWCQGRLENPCGAVCARGALFKVTTNPVYQNVEARLSKCVGGERDPVNNVVNWNNAPERTKEEVVAMMRHAAYQ